MKGLLISLTSLVAYSLARPDIGLNLRYQPPATSYGTPTGSYLPSASFNSHSRSSSQTSPGGYSNQYGGTNLDIADYARSGYQGANGLNQQTYQQPDFQPSQAQVHKHVYFYEAPEDLPAPTLRINSAATAAPAQKNYKIIFIKAPAYQAPKVPQIPIQQQNQEKTLVYVLVKNPDDAQDIVLPTLAPSKPSKPEVYFIKYKTQKEAEQHLQTIQQGAHAGVSANAVDNDQAFISSISDAKTTSDSSQLGGGLITSSNNDFNQQIFGGHSSASSSGAKFGQPGASGPY